MRASDANQIASFGQCVVGSWLAGVSSVSRIPTGHYPFQQNKHRLWLQALKREDWKDATAVKETCVCKFSFISPFSLPMSESVGLLSNVYGLSIAFMMGLVGLLAAIC